VFYSAKIQEKILQTNELKEISNEILRPGVSNLQISKFSTIIQAIFKRYPKLAIEKCPFIPKFIEFAEHNNVVTLISDLLKIKDDEVIIFDYLVEMQLPKLVAESIVNSKDINSDFVAGAYKLVTVFSNYTAMQKLYQNDNTVNLLYIQKTPTSPQVLASQWESAFHIMDSESLLYFLPLVKKAMEAVINIRDKIWPYHVFCFSFLSKISPLDEAQPQLKGISSAIINVIKSFPNHSIALDSVINLAIQIASIPGFGSSEMMNVLPVAGIMVKERSSVIVAAWCFKLIRDVRELNPEMTKLVDSLDPDILDTVKSISVAIDTPYGGVVPKQEASIMHDLSPEKILFFKKFFMLRL
jgi:hypothetical protein